MPEQPPKQVKLDTMEYSGINKAIQSISMHTGSDPPSFFGTGHVTVLMTDYSGVRQHRWFSALDFCSACSEWKE